MEDKDLLTILIAFVLGYFAHQMMRQMCDRRLVEGAGPGDLCNGPNDCNELFSCVNLKNGDSRCVPLNTYLKGKGAINKWLKNNVFEKQRFMHSQI